MAEKIAKLIPQNLIFALQFEEEVACANPYIPDDVLRLYVRRCNVSASGDGRGSEGLDS